MWRRRHELRILLGLPCNLLQRIDQKIQLFLGLALGGLDHHRALNHEWEGCRIGVKAIIDQPLAHVTGLDPMFRLQPVGKHNLMH